MRAKYIRFFISSTFADMELERNLLRDILTRLSAEYAKLGWQLEYVDLRWGISREASLDNRTMSICLEELRRCQELSPKPNFILLLGNRYGWIPLPEIVSLSNYEALEMTANEDVLFHRWYRLDENALAEPVYVLMPRTSPYDDDAVWHSGVEKPLMEMFERNVAYGNDYALSATEYEINAGVLKADAHNHVFAFFRDLYDVPHNERSKYEELTPTGVAKIRRLRHKLKSELYAKNTLEIECSYHEYCGEWYKDEFVEGAEVRLRSIIENAIAEAETDDELSYNLRHMAKATELADGFVGRETELQYIDSYVNNPEDNVVLWIKGKSGSGKSALLAKVVNRYSGSHDIVCRFCGSNPDPSDAKFLLRSLWNDIVAADKYKNERDKKLRFKSARSVIFDVDHFGSLFRKLHLTRPLLVVIDAIDQVDDSTYCNFHSLMWLNHKLRPDLKIIISSTDDVKYNFERTDIRSWNLPAIGSNAWLVIDSVLMRAGRKLCPTQWSQLSGILTNTDESALYAKILGNYLSDMPSWADLSLIPPTLDSLIEFIFNSLSRPERHGASLVEAVVRLFCAEDLGLTDSEVLRLLALDEDYVDSLIGKSFHQLDKADINIPPILWYRLKYDIATLLRPVNTECGVLIAFFHNELRRAVKRLYFSDAKVRTRYYHSLYEYYLGGIRNDDGHAFLQLVRTLYNAMMSCACYDMEQYQALGLQAWRLLTHTLDYILGKQSRYPKQLRADYELITPVLSPERALEFLSVKAEVAQLPEIADVGLLELQLCNLPDTSRLKKTYLSQFSIIGKIADDYSNIYIGNCGIIKNTLCNAFDAGYIRHIVDVRGRVMAISGDGDSIVSLYDNGHRVHTQNLVNSSKSRGYSLTSEIVDFICDDTLRYHLIVCEDTAFLYDQVENRTLKRLPVDKKRKSLSADGNVMVYGNGSDIEVYFRETGNTIRFNGIVDAMVSYSGKYVWLITEERILFRWDVATGDMPGFGHVDGDEARIVAVHDECCLTRRTLYRHCMENGKNRYFHWSYNVDLLVYVAWFDSTGSRLYMKEKPHCLTVLEFISDADLDVHVYPCPDIRCYNRNFVLTMGDREEIFNVEERIKFPYIPAVYNCGINALACDSSGKRIAVSAGINLLQEIQPFVYEINGTVLNSRELPFENKTFSYIACCAVSPDGNFMGASSFARERSELILCDMAGQRLIDKQTECACISICFSRDSRYMIGVTGDYISDPFDVNVYVYDVLNKSFIKQINLPEFYMYNKGGAFFTQNNNYIIFRTGSYYGVWDLWQNKLIYDDIKCSDRFIDRCGSKDFLSLMCFNANAYGLVFEHPWMNELISTDEEKKELIHVDLESLYTYSEPCDYSLVGMSPSGTILYFLKDGRLYRRHILEEENYIYLADNVQSVFTVFNDVHIFVYLNSGELIFMDVEARQVLLRANAGFLWDARACAVGLVTVDYLGKISRFEVPAKYQLNNPAIATFTGRWDLGEKVMREPSAVCPMCGAEMFLDDDAGFKPGGDALCPRCSANLHFNPML